MLSQKSFFRPWSMLTVASIILLMLAGGFLTATLWLDGQPAVQAQDEQGAVSNLSVSSPNPSQLVVAWSAPSETPTDYRVRWAPSDQDYLSFSEANTAERGSAYPSGTTHTVNNLAAGASYKIQVRARYNTGEHADNPWSGPWSDQATITISSPPPPPPTPEPTPEPASDVVTDLALSSETVGELVITWNQPSDEPNDYRVTWAPADEEYLSHSADNTAKRGNSYPGGDANTLTLTGLPGGITYKAIMRARYHDQETDEYTSGPWTGETTQRVRSDPPTAPTELEATETESKGETSIVLSWTAPSQGDLTGYRIHRGATAGSLTVMVQNTGDTEASYTDATTEADNTYVYAVTALSLDGDSPRSATKSITRGGGGTTTGDDPPPEDDENTVVEPAAALTPAAPGTPTSLPARPTGLSAQPSHDRVLLTWDDPGDDSISGYRILRRMRHLQAPGVFSVLLADSGSAAASYSDTDVVPETDYVYRVKAINADGLSTQSSFANALTPAAPPATSTASPQHLTAALLNGAITISWDPPTEDADAVTGYQILRRTPESGIPTLRQFQILVDNTASTDTSYTDRTATFDRLLYIYRIKALRAEQLSDWSNAAQYRARFGTLQPYDAVRPPPPTGLRASDDDGAVQLNWDPAPIVSPLLAEAATSYRIWRERLDQPILSWGGPATYRNISQASFRDSAVEAGGRYRYGVSVEQPHLKYSLASEPVIIEIPAPLSDDASLSSLALSADSLSPAFAAELTSYTADLDADVETVTLSAAATHSAATVAITPVDADTNAEGHQLSLAVGDNSVTVTVTAEDGASTRTYTLTLTRAAPPSDDASLSSLDVVDSGDGVALLTPAFDPATLSYATQVGADIEQVSVTATPADDGATVQIAPADADPDSDGHQVDVAEGAPAAVTVTVTAEDGATTRVYALSVLRDAQTPAAAASAGLDAAPGWTFDPATKRYHVAQSPAATAGRLRMTPASGSELDAFTVDAALRTRQIGTGGTTRLSSSADTILFIRAASGQRETLYSVRLRPPASASTSADQRLATKGGGWTATTRSNHNPTLSALTVSPGALDPAFAAATHAYTVEVAHDVAQLTITPTAAGSANATVTGDDADTDTPGHQVALNARTEPQPVETTIAIVVSDGTNMASYTITATRAAPPPFGLIRSGRFNLPQNHPDLRPSGLWSDGENMWIGTWYPIDPAGWAQSNCGDSPLRVAVFDMDTGKRDPQRDIATSCHVLGLWSDGEILYAASETEYLTAYDLNTRRHRADLDLPVIYPPFIWRGQGVWSDGDTFWTIYRGTITACWRICLVAFHRGLPGWNYYSSSQVPLSETKVGRQYLDSRGLWSDGHTMWVGNQSHRKLDAYDMATGERDTLLDFDTLIAADMWVPAGMWSDGRTMFVADVEVREVFEFRMPALPVLYSLELSGIDIGHFRLSKYDYTVVVPNTVTSTTVTAEAAAAAASLVITPADSDTATDGRQVNLSVGENEIEVTVTEGTESRTYTVTVTRQS